MIKTEIDGVYQVERGVFVEMKETDYQAQRRRALELEDAKQRINMLENSVNNMNELLQQILQQVSK